MALHSLRLRRGVAAVSFLLNPYHMYPSLSHQPLIFPPPRFAGSILQTLLAASSPASPSQTRLFRASSILQSPPRFQDDDAEIGPDTILFEGCDYNHWLITMEFPDSKPTPEEMVEAYVQTLAKGLNISIEEAKKRMYACSTTTYVGFQAVMTEEESQKFEGLPGVVFVLPDSYIDPVNKEYGGDKYINGTIIPRPPPVQYGRSGGRYNDRNRNYDRPPRYDRQGGPAPNQQWGGGPPQNYQPQQSSGPPYQQNHGLPRHNQGPQQNYGTPQQNYGAPQQNYGRPQQNYGPPQQNYGPPQQNYGHSQQNYGPPQQNYGPSQQNYGPPQQNYVPSQQNYGPPQQNYRNPQQNYGAPQPIYGNHQPNYGSLQQNEGERRDSVPISNTGYDGDQVGKGEHRKSAAYLRGFGEDGLFS